MKMRWMVLMVAAALLVSGCRSRAPESADNSKPAPPVMAAPAPTPPPIATPPPAKESAPAAEKPAAPAPAAARRPAAAPARLAATLPARPVAAAPAATVPAAPPPRPLKPAWHEVTLRAGTALPLVLDTELSSRTARVETPVRAHLRDAILVDGAVALPKGAVLLGVVTDVAQSGRVQGRAHLAFTFDRIELRDSRVPVRTHPIRVEAEPTKSDDAAKVGVGAIGGAIVGGILGDGKGAAAGATIGGAAGAAAVLVTRGEEVELKPGTSVATTLAEPVTVTVPAHR